MDQLFSSLGTHPLAAGGIALAAFGYIMSLVRGVPSGLFKFAKARLITSVEIEDRDPAFGWLENWLSAHPGSHGKRAFIARARLECSQVGCSTRDYPGPIPETSARERFRFTFTPAQGGGMVRFRGHWLWVERRRRWYEQAFNGAPHSDTFVITRLGSIQVIKDLLQEAMSEAAKPGDQGIPILVGDGGHWGHQGFKAKRPFESVMLDAGLLEELVADMDAFYRSEKWYGDRGIPWHRGYLFAGIPGAGKTSTALAIAGELGLNVAVVSLTSGEMNDQAITRLMLALPERSLLLIEDVDALFEERKSSCRVTFGGFLNALDGVAASEGRVLVMTTNHPEKLDPALIRFGRVDRRVDFTYATPDQARRLFLWFYRDQPYSAEMLTAMAEQFAASIAAERVSMAAIQERLVRHRDSPGDAATYRDELTIAA